MHNFVRQKVKKIRDISKYWVSRLQRDNINIEILRNTLEPIFVIGANRSGTSVVSYILSQHPDVEGLFSGTRYPDYDKHGHSYGFCESGHLWRYLSPNMNRRLSAFWGLPKNSASIYRQSALSTFERNLLAWDVLSNRKSEKIPLIKNNLNTLRIGLIKDVFPKAKFVLVCRPLNEFVCSSLHKWANDGVNYLSHLPRASLHWHLVNLTARYDLETFAQGSYTILWLDKIKGEKEEVEGVFKKLLNDLSLDSYEFDQQYIEKKKESVSCENCEDSFIGIREIVNIERTKLVSLNVK